MKFIPFTFLSFLLACGGAQRSDSAGSAEADESASAEDTSSPQDSESVESASTDGAYGIPNATQLDENLLVGAQPSPEQIRELAKAGFTTVISLRQDGEPGTEGERANVQASGMRFVQVPVAGADDLTEARIKEVDEAIEASEGPVFLHCGTSNRAGSVVALRAFYFQGKSMGEALSLGQRAGMDALAPVVREKLLEKCKEQQNPDC